MIDIWVPVTLTAALAQTFRFALQKRLKLAGFSTAATTLARFLYSAPLVVAGVLVYARLSGQTLPPMGPDFWLWSLTGGIAQILATLCTVALFSLRNFAVGMTFKKTEVLMTAIFGMVLLGDQVNAWGWGALVVGLLAVLMLGEPATIGGARLWNRATALGLTSGALFAVSAVSYRAAAIGLPSGDTALRAGLTLATTTSVQVALMVAVMGWRMPEDLRATLRGWRLALPVGVTSMIGSFCWFTAFALTNAAFVNALGQIELLFSLTLGWLMFGERVKRRELLGIALLLLSILVLILMR